MLSRAFLCTHRRHTRTRISRVRDLTWHTICIETFYRNILTQVNEMQLQKYTHFTPRILFLHALSLSSSCLSTISVA